MSTTVPSPPKRRRFRIRLRLLERTRRANMQMALWADELERLMDQLERFVAVAERLTKLGGRCARALAAAILLMAMVALRMNGVL